jgi:acetyl-CoA synthetase (ADP-forming)
LIVVIWLINKLEEDALVVASEGWLISKQIGAIIDEAANSGRFNLLEPEAKEICKLVGIPVPKFAVAGTAAEAARIADRIGYPSVLKIVSPDILHKTEAGGVIVGVKNVREVRRSFNRLRSNAKQYNSQAHVEGVLIEKMAPQGIEVIIGSVRDPQFGPTVMFGIGGIFAEILKDVTFRVAPITKCMALQMIPEVKAHALLNGYRNLLPVDKGAIAEILVKISNLVTQFPKISEVDLNPTIGLAKGAMVVDARILLERK